MVLLSISLVGVLIFFAIRPTPWASGSDNTAKSSPVEVFISAFKLLANPKMLLLIFSFSYYGTLMTFWTSVYGTAIGRTRGFGKQAKSLVGLNGIAIGVGEIIGGNSKSTLRLVLYAVQPTSVLTKAFV